MMGRTPRIGGGLRSIELRRLRTSMTHDTTAAKITIGGVLDRPGIAAAVFRGLAKRTVNVDKILQNISHDGTTDISFTVSKDDLATSLEVASELRSSLGP